MQEIDVIIRVMPNADDIEITLPLDSKGNDIIETLLNAGLGIPRTDPGSGEAYIYDLIPKGKNTKMYLNEIIEGANIQAGDIILMVPRLVAGGYSGSLIFMLPQILEINQKERATIRISTKELEEYIIKEKILSQHEIKEIEINKVMKVSLEENTIREILIIKDLSEKEQIIEDNTYSEWIFDIYPISIGHTSLIMRITLMDVLEKFGKTGKDVFLHDRSISVFKDRQTTHDNLEYFSSGEFDDYLLWNDNIKERIVAFISVAETEKALSILINYLQRIDYTLSSSLILLQSQWNEGKNKYLLNLILHIDWGMIQSKINYAILEIVKDIDLKIRFSRDHLSKRREGIKNLGDSINKL